MVPLGTIYAEELGWITVTDDIDEVVRIMAEHRDWKKWCYQCRTTDAQA